MFTVKHLCFLPTYPTYYCLLNLPKAQLWTCFPPKKKKKVISIAPYHWKNQDFYLYFIFEGLLQDLSQTMKITVILASIAHSWQLVMGGRQREAQLGGEKPQAALAWSSFIIPSISNFPSPSVFGRVNTEPWSQSWCDDNFEVFVIYCPLWHCLVFLFCLIS